MPSRVSAFGGARNAKQWPQSISPISTPAPSTFRARADLGTLSRSSPYPSRTLAYLRPLLTAYLQLWAEYSQPDIVSLLTVYSLVSCIA